MNKLILLLALVLLTGCASKQLQSIKQIDDALNTTILQPSQGDTPHIKNEKVLVRNTLIESKGTIIEQEKETENLQAKIKTEQKFSRIGKWLVGVVVGLFILVIVVFSIKIYLRIQTGGFIK